MVRFKVKNKKLKKKIVRVENFRLAITFQIVQFKLENLLHPAKVSFYRCHKSREIFEQN